MSKQIFNGILFRSHTHGDDARGWYASLEKCAPHRYGKRTAHGERVRWRGFANIALGKFATRGEARAACKAAIQARHPLSSAPQSREN